jgi:hypothetical protein
VPAAQEGRRPAHGAGVEAVATVVAVAAHEQVGHLAVVDDVAVELAQRVAVGVEVVVYFLGGAHDDIGRQAGVDGAKEDGGGQGRVGAEVDDLADGVDAGVGAAAGVDPDALLAGQVGDGLFEGLLHGAQARLSLPAVEVGAVVGQR